MSRRVIKQRRKTAKRPQPKHRMDGTFKVSKVGKYNAQGQRIDGHFFASKAESQRYIQLKRLENTGVIQQLELQPKYSISIQGHMICQYVADFRYRTLDNGRVTAIIIEDVKGMITPEYKLKSKLFRALYSEPLYEMPAQWIEDYEGKTAPECQNIIKNKGDARAARIKLKRAKRRAAKALESVELSQHKETQDEQDR